MLEKEKREFKGIWFPAEVWLDERLTPVEKMILMEIDSLDNKDNCYASNEHLARFCQCSQSKVSKAISKLKSLGYVEVVSFDGRSRKLRSCLAFCTKQTSKICQSDEQNLQERVLEESSRKNTKEDNVEIPFSEIIDYLNEKANRRYRPSTPKTREHIRARWNEGYRLDDFKRVIDVKVADWLGDDKMDRYLCPDTLFGTKFEKYLNQPMLNGKIKPQRQLDFSGYGQPKPGDMRVNNQTGITEVYQEDGTWKVEETTEEDFDDIDF